MEKDKNKVKEPFPPEHTPEPPQVMDTSRQPESGTKENEQAKFKEREAGEKDKKKPEGDTPDKKDESTT